jgi:hypothetical protein
MRALYLSYKDFDSFIKMQLVVIFVISLSWALILPIVTKLQGLLWATSIISGYLILHQLSVFLMPMMRNVSLKQSYKWMIWLDFIYCISVLLFFYDELIFLYTEATLMVAYGIVISVFGINYDAFLMEKYSTESFKDIQYVERMVMAVAGIVGYLIVIFVDVLSEDVGTSIKVFLVILMVNLGIQLYNYKYFWNDLTEQNKE